MGMLPVGFIGSAAHHGRDIFLLMLLLVVGSFEISY